MSQGREREIKYEIITGLILKNYGSKKKNMSILHKL